MNLRRVAIRVAEFVRPSRFPIYLRARCEIGLILGENGIHFGAHCGFEIVIRYQTDHLVPFIPHA